MSDDEAYDADWTDADRCEACHDEDAECPEHEVPSELYDWLADEAHPNFCGVHVPQSKGEEFADAAAWGAGWAFAIVGMAQAIRLGRFCEICGYGMSNKVSDGPWLCIGCGRG